MTNVRDKNALLLESDPAGSILGYLPRGISLHLAPLVKQGAVRSLATVLELGQTPTSAMSITLEVNACRGYTASVYPTLKLFK